MTETLQSDHLIEAFDQSGASPPRLARISLLASPTSQLQSAVFSTPLELQPGQSTVAVGHLRWAAPHDAALGRIVLPVPTGLTTLEDTAGRSGDLRAYGLIGAAVCLKPCDVERVFGDGESESFLHVRAAASRAGVHEETLRRAYRNNQLAAQRVGVRGIRIHPVELKDWMADGMPTRPKASPRNRPALEEGA